MRIGLIREAGGYGDIICLGGASKRLKEEILGCEVIAYVPEPYVDVARHLRGVDRVVSLGRMVDIVHCRRTRLCDLNLCDRQYFQAVLHDPPDVCCDMLCPAFTYEASTDILKYTRSQLFAMAAGVKQISDAIPEWIVQGDEFDRARSVLSKVCVGAPFIVVGLRGTCSTRTYPVYHAEKLLQLLSDTGYSIIYLDCCRPRFRLPRGVVYVNEEFSTFAAIVALSLLVVTVDSCLLHLSEALRKPCVSIFGNTDSTPFQLWYRNVVPVEDFKVCGQGCNYRVSRGWDRIRCRREGCIRMMNVTPDAVSRAVKLQLEELSLLTREYV